MVPLARVWLIHALTFIYNIRFSHTKARRVFTLSFTIFHSLKFISCTALHLKAHTVTSRKHTTLSLNEQRRNDCVFMHLPCPPTDVNFVEYAQNSFQPLIYFCWKTVSQTPVLKFYVKISTLQDSSFTQILQGILQKASKSLAVLAVLVECTQLQFDRDFSSQFLQIGVSPIILWHQYGKYQCNSTYPLALGLISPRVQSMLADSCHRSERPSAIL